AAQTLPPEAAALIARLARPVPATTPYAEVRYVRLLREPLVLHGELSYAGGDRLAKRVDAPYREKLTIADGQALVAREGRSARRFSFAQAPERDALLRGFSALLGGAASVLAGEFKVNLAAQADRWTLSLQPLTPALAKHLRALVVDGSGSEPQCFSLYQT